MAHIPGPGPETSRWAVPHSTPLPPNHEAPVLTGQSPPHNSPRPFRFRRPSTDTHRQSLGTERLRPPDNGVVLRPFHSGPRCASQRINGRAGIPPPAPYLAGSRRGRPRLRLHLSTKGFDKPGEALPPCFHKTRPTAEPWVTFPLSSAVHVVRELPPSPLNRSYHGGARPAAPGQAAVLPTGLQRNL